MQVEQQEGQFQLEKDYSAARPESQYQARLRRIICLVFLSLSIFICVRWYLLTQDLYSEEKEQFQFSKQVLTYSSLGVPTIGDRFNDTAVARNEFKMFDQILLNMFKPFDDTDCQLAHYGNYQSEGFLLCSNLMQHSHALVNFNSKAVEDFECQVSSLFSLPSFLYSCSGRQESKCPVQQKMSYIQSCANHVKARSFFNLTKVINSNNIQKKYLIWKLSLEEGLDFQILRHLPLDQLDQIDQLVMRVNFPFQSEELWGNIDIFKSISSKMIPVNFKENNSQCLSLRMQGSRKLMSSQIDLTFVNKKLVKMHSEGRSWVPHPLNAPSKPNFPPC